MNTKPNYLFEVSWEVSNMVGGIYTVLSTKASILKKELQNNYILIGPDVWKETVDNPLFIEDKSLLRAWREVAEIDGINFKIGYWNIESKPIAILVDFSKYINEKDKILADFWEKYYLDSISGGWDYIEPVLFGYAAGKVIESFYDYNVTAQDSILAHFHEWMTGSGILYLKQKAPQIGLVFTTHATVLGRSIAGNNLPLYDQLNAYVPSEIAKKFNLTAKHSLEEKSAATCDVFTTVSQITAKECEHFLNKKNDVITTNGFDEKLVLSDEEYLAGKKRKISRQKFLEVAAALTNETYSDDTFIVATSGRYEYKNKGIDVFIDSLAKYNASEKSDKKVLAFIMVPSNNLGASSELIDALKNNDNKELSNKFLTHNLVEPNYDPILNKLKEVGLNNCKNNKVKVFFVPSYLNGNDGIFNLTYWDLLKGVDLSIFPSYYEPWGYTPLESIAFGVPTVTTTLAGFGMWCKDLQNHDGVFVVERTDGNYDSVVEDISNILSGVSNLSEKQQTQLGLNAIAIARKALWNNLFSNYNEAYKLAIEKVNTRRSDYLLKKQADIATITQSQKHITAEWKKVLVKLKVPEALNGLFELSNNLYWCWNNEAIELFESIDKEKWAKLNNNPVALLESLRLSELEALTENETFMARLQKVYSDFKAYMDKKSEQKEPQIAYFSMEYGLHESLQIYSGGLGVLAGDYLKEASDSNVNMIGVGLLYRYGYFHQSFSPSGDQIAMYHPQKFSTLPLIPVRDENGDWLTVSIALPGRNLTAKAWCVNVGRIPLYLLDTDIEENNEADRSVTHQLYGGDWENRFKQELLLGVGGIRLINKLKLQPQIYHCNEGHAAFMGVERLNRYINTQQMSFFQALELVKSSTLFTTHTPVPAGHDEFAEDMVRTYLAHYPERLTITWNDFMNLGRWNEDNEGEKFSMSVLATKLSQEMNGVSRIHGTVSQKMFQPLYPGYYLSESHIGYVTNGIHYPTWVNSKWDKLYRDTFGEEFLKDQSNPTYWENIHNVDDKVIWDIRQDLRKVLVDFIKKHLQDNIGKSQTSPRRIIDIVEKLDHNVLTIGFARRFATYKRAHLLFTDLERLEKIVNHKDRPIQFVFAGKAHPHDKAGSDLIKRIIQISHMPQFVGKIIFLENYSMATSRKLVQGVDIWLNTPTRPLEASGTSGEKTIMNGIVNLSVLDGWWAEGYKENAGWALAEERTFENQKFQDELDAEIIYNYLEDEIAPLFYNRDKDGIPHQWIQYIKNTISGIAPHFTMKRQLDDYYAKFYSVLDERHNLLKKDDCKNVRILASFKYKVARYWNDVKVLEVLYPDSTARPLELGEKFKAVIKLDTSAIDPQNIKVELILGQKVDDKIGEPISIKKFDLEKNGDNLATYTIEFPTVMSGVFDFSFRITPTHPLLPYSHDMKMVKWI
ncbi:MAG: alpha-glucan family phosphorylase [Lentimicrobiaceae bacterium]|nr:alpha-glucan family phosphorylase [Lentimicrobiaceae bacterium]